MKPYYEHAGITIFHGRCEEILPTLGPVDLVLTDPPYGIGADDNAHKKSGDIQGHGHRRVAARVYPKTNWDMKPPDRELIHLVVSAGKYAILFGGNFFELPTGGKWLVWDKINDGNDFADCELAWTNIPGAVRIKRHLWNGMCRDHAEIRYDHPTQKPLSVMAWAINQSPQRGSLVDPFCGSGTALVAAKAAGIPAIGIEIEERYCEIAAKRLSQEVLDF